LNSISAGTAIGKRRTYKLSIASGVESYEFPAAESILRTMQEK
jgi:hypothetical protein